MPASRVYSLIKEGEEVQSSPFGKSIQETLSTLQIESLGFMSLRFWVSDSVSPLAPCPGNSSGLERAEGGSLCHYPASAPTRQANWVDFILCRLV